MPNRIIKESICTSSEIDQLPPEAEVTFYRMIVNCDDYGRMEAEPKQLRAKLYPNKIDQITDADIDAWTQALTQPGPGGHSLIFLYRANGRRYLQITRWEEHQRIRAKRSKHPDPSQGTILKKPQDTAVIKKPQEKAKAKKEKKRYEPDSNEIMLAEELKAKILENNPNAAVPANLQEWAKHFDLMIRKDNRTLDQIRAIIGYSQDDPFWQTNILSAKTLRAKYDTLSMQAKAKSGRKQPQAWSNIKNWLTESEAGS